MELDKIKIMMVVVLIIFLGSVNSIPINSTNSTTISDHSYCNETGSTSNTSSNNLLNILYNDLDQGLDVLGQVCLNYDEIVRLSLYYQCITILLNTEIAQYN